MLSMRLSASLPGGALLDRLPGLPDKEIHMNMKVLFSSVVIAASGLLGSPLQAATAEVTTTTTERSTVVVPQPPEPRVVVVPAPDPEPRVVVVPAPPPDPVVIAPPP